MCLFEPMENALICAMSEVTPKAEARARGSAFCVSAVRVVSVSTRKASKVCKMGGGGAGGEDGGGGGGFGGGGGGDGGAGGGSKPPGGAGGSGDGGGGGE